MHNVALEYYSNVLSIQLTFYLNSNIDKISNYFNLCKIQEKEEFYILKLN